jgi:hypothetical protein
VRWCSKGGEYCQYHALGAARELKTRVRALEGGGQTARAQRDVPVARLAQMYGGQPDVFFAGEAHVSYAVVPSLGITAVRPARVSVCCRGNASLTESAQQAVPAGQGRPTSGRGLNLVQRAGGAAPVAAIAPIAAPMPVPAAPQRDPPRPAMQLAPSVAAPTSVPVSVPVSASVLVRASSQPTVPVAPVPVPTARTPAWPPAPPAAAPGAAPAGTGSGAPASRLSTYVAKARATEAYIAAAAALREKMDTGDEVYLRPSEKHHLNDDAKRIVRGKWGFRTTLSVF